MAGPPAASRTRAIAQVTVDRSSAEPFDEAAGGALSLIAIAEQFAGDVTATSPVRALQWQGDDRAVQVSMQRVTGSLAGRQGSFVLQGEEVVADGRISATWQVVCGSGTGELSGLRGEGGFEGEFGKGSEAILDFWFE